MPQGQAAYEKDVLISEEPIDFDTVTSYDDLGANEYVLPASDASLNAEGEELDDTTLKTEGSRSRLIGVLDWSIDVTLNWEKDAEGNVDGGLNALRKGVLNRERFYAYYLPDGIENPETGYEGRVVPQNFNQDGAVGDIESLDFTLPSAGELDIIEE